MTDEQTETPPEPAEGATTAEPVVEGEFFALDGAGAGLDEGRFES